MSGLLQLIQRRGAGQMMYGHCCCLLNDEIYNKYIYEIYE